MRDALREEVKGKERALDAALCKLAQSEAKAAEINKGRRFADEDAEHFRRRTRGLAQDLDASKAREKDLAARLATAQLKINDLETARRKSDEHVAALKNELIGTRIVRDNNCAHAEHSKAREKELMAKTNALTAECDALQAEGNRQRALITKLESELFRLRAGDHAWKLYKAPR